MNRRYRVSTPLLRHWRLLIIAVVCITLPLLYFGRLNDRSAENLPNTCAPCPDVCRTPNTSIGMPFAAQMPLQTSSISPAVRRLSTAPARREGFVLKEDVAAKYAFLRDFEASHLLAMHNFTQPPLAHACIQDAAADLDVTQPIPSLRVVYYISFMKDRFWATKFIVEHQLVELALIGLADNAELHIVVQTPDPTNIVWLKELVERLRLPTVRYYFLERNLWEFPGIHLIWELACREDNPSALYLYLHSKGVSRMVEGKRWRDEIVVFHEVVVPWRAIVRLFMDNTRNIDTVGLVASPEGYQWFNIWWARGSYLMRMAEPGITMSKRHYYEYYLAQHLPEDAIHTVLTTTGETRRVGSHCLAARAIFSGIHSSVLLHSTYNYNENAPLEAIQLPRTATGAYTLRACALDARVQQSIAAATIFQRCSLLQNAAAICSVDTAELSRKR